MPVHHKPTTAARCTVLSGLINEEWQRPKAGWKLEAATLGSVRLIVRNYLFSPNLTCSVILHSLWVGWPWVVCVGDGNCPSVDRPGVHVPDGGWRTEDGRRTWTWRDMATVTELNHSDSGFIYCCTYGRRFCNNPRLSAANLPVPLFYVNRLLELCMLDSRNQPVEERETNHGSL